MEKTTVCYDKEIKKYISLYKSTKKPIDVNFRKLIPELTSQERFTHLIHSYPAKLLGHIPYFFLNNNFFSKKGDKILDPFCGTGTVLLETLISGRKAYGADANPLARLIAKTKATKINSDVLNKELKSILLKSVSYKKGTDIEIANKDFWFSSSSQEQLSKIFKAINYIKDSEIQDFFWVCFSNCIKKVSYADPRISVPVKLNPARFSSDAKLKKAIKNKLLELETVNVYEKFKSICVANINRIESLNKTKIKYSPKIISADARRITKTVKTDKIIDSGYFDLIITSPPYAGAQKYIRASSLNLGWLNWANMGQLKFLDSKNIGRENYYKSEIELVTTGIDAADKLIKAIYKIKPDRAFIVGNYLKEMMHALDESYRVLRKGGHLILIVGNTTVCNKEFNIQEYFTTYLVGKKMKIIFKLIDDIKSYGLMTKRNKTADIISREWVLVFKK